MSNESSTIHTIQFSGSGVFNPDVLDATHKQLDAVEADSSIEAVFLRGEGKNFSQGLDLEFLMANPDVFSEFDLPDQFDFAMARAQVDNNMEKILCAYAKSGLELVYVSNWTSSRFGLEMLNRYGDIENLHLIGPIYDVGKIKAL